MGETVFEGGFAGNRRKRSDQADPRIEILVSVPSFDAAGYFRVTPFGLGSPDPARKSRDPTARSPEEAFRVPLTF